MFTPIMLRRYLAEFLGTFAYVFLAVVPKSSLGTRRVSPICSLSISPLA